MSPIPKREGKDVRWRRMPLLRLFMIGFLRPTRFGEKLALSATPGKPYDSRGPYPHLGFRIKERGPIVKALSIPAYIVNRQG
jgi:hypothetical protein